ncbi:MAG: VanZ family protein [Blautia sp.]|nr:VanZ family protein [Blautia sp.]
MNSFVRQDFMQTVMIILLLAAGYFFLLSEISKRAADKRSVPTLAGVLLVIMGGVSAVLYFMFSSTGNTGLMLIFIIMLYAVITVAAMVFYIVNNHEYMSKGAFIIFLLYILAVLYITLFSRKDVSISTILVQPFAHVSEALRMHSFEPLQHELLNIAMFVPVGFLFCMIDPEELCRVAYVLPVGMLFSVLIETLQLLLRRGQCDIDDIISNSLGAVVGYLIFRVFHRFEE